MKTREAEGLGQDESISFPTALAPVLPTTDVKIFKFIARQWTVLTSYTCN